MTINLKTVVILTSIGLSAYPLIGVAHAASAHNSQAGAYGPTSNSEGPTPASPGRRKIMKRHGAKNTY